ncbi:hypothetical protein O3M35_007865 [Rhynocoris fuscipes]|uniref:Conserved oligomeric Golgi complex subunit 8 n=1 Tax=Rhynocoris fuscipes TaxID=488301 RepID=A0AAW1DBP8_9HEMI
MDFDSSIKLMFPNGIPDSWIDNPDFTNYLSKLGLYNVSQLCKELDHLSAEKASILNQTQELAFANYKTFIQTAECSREIFQQFQKCEQSLESLVEGVPKFSEECEEFVRRCGQIKAERQINSVTLARHSSILLLLEVPQLMDTAVREGLYDEALSLASYVRRLATLHSNIPVIKKLCSEIDACWATLTKRLIWELHGELQLPRCLQVVGVLRRMGIMSDAELRLKFLHARDSFFYNLITRISNEQKSQRLNKVIEVYRTQLFNIITQYRAVFPEQDSILTTSKQHFNEYPVLHEWINNKVCELISAVEREASEGRCDVSSIEQVMYLGQSLGRVGVDVRGLAGPVFSRALCRLVGNQLSAADHRFVADMDRFSLESVKGVTMTPSLSHLTPSTQQPNEQHHHMKCEVSNIEYYPLARYTNSLLSVLNQLRLCAPLCLAQPVTDMLQQSLQSVASSIAQFYTREQQAMSAEERDLLTKMVVCFNDYLVPYIQRGLQSVYSPTEISFFLSVSVSKLQEKGLTFFNMAKISSPIQHLLPVVKLDLTSSQYLSENTKENVQDEEKTINSANEEVTAAS